MEEFGSSGVYGSSTMRRKRSQTSRRPRLDSQQFAEGLDPSPSSSTPPSDDAVKVSSDENGGDAHSRRKELSLNQCVSRVSSASGADSERSLKRSKKDGNFNSYYRGESGRSGNDNKRSSEGVLAPANWRSTSKASDGVESESSSIDPYGGRYGESSSSGQKGLFVDGLGNDNKVKKVKLKVGGVTRTIQATSPPNGASKGSASSKGSQLSDVHRQKQNFQENLNGNHCPSDKKSGLHGIPWRDFSRGGFGLEKEESLTGKMSGSGRNSNGKHGDKSESLRKSKRASKKRVLNGEFDDEDEDDEIRYLEKLKTSRASAGYHEDGEGPSKKQRKLSSISMMENFGASNKDGKKTRSDMAPDDKDYEEEADSVSEGDTEANHKNQRKESIDTLMDGKREMTLTTRQRALQSGKDASSARGGGLIEFPNGLPPAPPRKQKEKLTEVEQQLKKAEAAQRRRMQVEKAARESEAEAIRKILGQDSSRKKREDKIKKRQEELAQEKAANAHKLLSNTIRWVLSPTGTVVTFSNDMGLPSIFDSKSSSYPPRRENCAGPSCSNPYKYRDSKSKLPLCSLMCYKAIQKQLTEATC